MLEKYFSEKYLTTSDGVKIAFNHYDASRNSVIIIAHGWFMTKDSKIFSQMSEDFFEYLDVITMDFRGHGKSGGSYTFSAKEAEDLKIVVDFAKQNYANVHLIGFSLGGAIATLHTAKHKNINTLILVSAPSAFDKIENHFWKKEAFIPTIQKFEVNRALSIRAGNLFLEKINPIDVISEIVSTPILIIAGGKDPTVYPRHAEEFFEKANEPKVLEIVQDAIHAEDIYLHDDKKFIQICIDWIEGKYLT